MAGIRGRVSNVTRPGLAGDAEGKVVPVNCRDDNGNMGANHIVASEGGRERRGVGHYMKGRRTV